MDFGWIFDVGFSMGNGLKNNGLHFDYCSLPRPTHPTHKTDFVRVTLIWSYNNHMAIYFDVRDCTNPLQHGLLVNMLV